MQQQFFGDQKRVVLTSRDNRIVLAGPPVTVQAMIDPGKAKGFAMATPLAPGAPEVATATFLNIEGVRATKPPGVVFGVYLNQAGVQDAAKRDQSLYAGSIAIFRSAGPDHDHGGGAALKPDAGENFSFDITDIVRGLKDRGVWCHQTRKTGS